MVENKKSLTIDEILSLRDEPNLLPYLDKNLIENETGKAKTGYDDDMASISEWRNDREEIAKFAAQQADEKVYPYPGASNIIFPLITEAILQFNARAYPAVFNNGNIVLAKVVGRDEGGVKKQRADRISSYMSYQVTEEIEDWDNYTDQLLMALPQDGVAFKKGYYSALDDTLVSEFVPAMDLVVNNAAKDLKSCPRISHMLNFYPYEVQEKVNSGDFDEDIIEAMAEDEKQNPEGFIEQHTLIDLDDDGYPEPYILTFHENTGKPARLVADFIKDDINRDEDGTIISIKRRCYFVKFSCFPSTDGSFYTPGLGSLLLHHNDSINAVLNQLIDAGHLANSQSGFLGLEFTGKSGSIRMSPGKFIKTDVPSMYLKDSVMLTPVRDPSMVLFQLLGMLIDGGKSIASIQDVMTGGGDPNAAVGTTMAMIEQGLKVYTGIFKRIYRGLRDEFRLLYELNTLYLEPEKYLRVSDDPEADANDFESVSFDVMPAADPNMATDIQKQMRDQELMQLVGVPGVNSQEIIKLHIENMGIENPERFLLPPPPKPEPTLDEMAKMITAQAKAKSVDIDAEKAKTEQLTDLANVIEILEKVDKEGGNLVAALSELGALEFFQQKFADASKDREKERQAYEANKPTSIPGLEGSQQMAMGPTSGGNGSSRSVAIPPGQIPQRPEGGPS